MKKSLIALALIVTFSHLSFAGFEDPPVIIEEVTFPVNGSPFIVFGHAHLTYKGTAKIHSQIFEVMCVSDTDPNYRKGSFSEFTFSLKRAVATNQWRTPHSVTIAESNAPLIGNVTCTSLMISTSPVHLSFHSLAVWPSP